MPRVAIKKKDYMKQDFCQWIIGKNHSQEELGRVLGTTQQGMSYKLKNCSFSFEEVVTLLDYLKATDEEIVRLIKL